MRGRSRRSVLIAAALVATVAGLLALPYTRTRILLALFGIDAPLGPKRGAVREEDCTFRDEELSDAENAKRSDERCDAAIVRACGARALAEVDHYTRVVPSCLDKIPGCHSRYGRLPGRRVAFRCLSGPRSRLDPYKDDPENLELDERGP